MMAWAVAMVAIGVIGARGVSAAEPAGVREGGAGPKVTVEIKDATLDDALRAIFKDTEQSVVVQSGIIVGSPVNLSLKNVPLEDAVKAVTELNGLDYKRVGSVWIVSQKEGMLSVGGVKVPVVGTVAGVPEDLDPSVLHEYLKLLKPRIVREGGGGGGGSAWWERRLEWPSAPAKVEFPGSEALVDLDVKDAPLSEVAAKLSAAVNATLEKQAEERERLEGAARDESESEVTRRGGVVSVGRAFFARHRVNVVAHESVGKVRVTAKVYRWPAGEVLRMLIDQAGLVHTSQVEESTAPDPSTKGVFWQTSSTTIYLVPQPVLEVTGATSGVRAEGER